MQRGKPFEPGNTSGRGRPKGSRNKATLDREALLDEFGAAITRKCVAEALKGDKSALRLCMERLLPPARHQTAAFKLPSIRSTADLPHASAAVLKAVADGTVSAQEGETFVRMLETHQRLLESQELASRIEALEHQGETGTAVELVDEESAGSVNPPAEGPNHAE